MQIKDLLIGTEEIRINGHIYLNYDCTEYGDIIITNKRILIQKKDSIQILNNKSISRVDYYNNDKNYLISIHSLGEKYIVYFPKTTEWRSWSEKVFTELSSCVVKYFA